MTAAPHPLTIAAARRAELLRDLTRAKATFQLRAITAALDCAEMHGSKPDQETAAAAVRRAAIDAGEARALQLTTTPRKPGDPVVRLMKETDE